VLEMSTLPSSGSQNCIGDPTAGALLTTKDVAKRLQIHPGSVRRNYQRGLIKGIKLNARLLRFSAAQVEEYISGGFGTPRRPR
jgi:excisionase family DNA binding protein